MYFWQAYCSQTEWLVFDNSENPVCETRKCPVGQLPFKDRCVKLDGTDRDCKNFERIIFLEDSLSPACGDGSTSEFSNLSGPKLKCKPGTMKDIVGKCRQNIKFNLDGWKYYILRIEEFQLRVSGIT